MSIKEIIKSILPKCILEILRACIEKRAYNRFVKIEKLRYYKASKDKDSLVKIESQISMICHIIEKGLTMPNMKLGFGKDNILKLSKMIEIYIEKGFDIKRVQVQHAVSVLLEYIEVHKDLKFQLDEKIISTISKISKRTNIVKASTQHNYTPETFFADINSSFDKFSSSRHSVRNYEGEVNIDDIVKAVKLANNTPSSCNRQASRVYIIKDKQTIKQVLECQNGHRGFGELADKLIVLTADMRVYNGLYEKNSVYVDGGMYGMNLLYALHQNKIAACTLNCYLSVEKEIKLRGILDIPESEVFVFILSLGKVPNEFKVAISQRNNPQIQIK